MDANFCSFARQALGSSEQVVRVIVNKRYQDSGYIPQRRANLPVRPGRGSLRALCVRAGPGDRAGRSRRADQQPAQGLADEVLR